MDNNYFDFIRNNEELTDKQLCQKIWAGKHISPWFFLRNAVRSSLMHSFNASSRWIESCHKEKQKGSLLAKRVKKANNQYELTLSGPLLSSIILSATCIEAFTRHCYVSVLRSRDISGKALCDIVSKFDKMTSMARIVKVIKEVKAKKITESITDKITDLLNFRNDIMHSDPIYHTQNDAELKQIKYGKEEEPKQYKYYPDVTLSNRPLSLTHAILATITHDELIEHIKNTSEDANILKFLEEVEMTNSDGGLIWGFMPGIKYEKAKSIAEEMNQMNKELNRVTLKEQIDFIR